MVAVAVVVVVYTCTYNVCHVVVIGGGGGGGVCVHVHACMCVSVLVHLCACMGQEYSGTSLIRAVWDPGVPVTLKLLITLNLFMNYVHTVHGYIKTLVTSTESIKMYTCNSIRNIYESGSAK